VHTFKTVLSKAE